MTGFHALLLAGGAGSRFGGRKLLAPWRGEPLVCAAARIALASPVDHCFAVTGSEGDLVEMALESVGDGRLTVLRCPDWSDGLSASLRYGLRALPATSLGVVVFLADMPLIPAQAAAPLLEALARGAPAAEYRLGDQPAHPVAFASGLYPELALLKGDQGGRSLLADRAGVVRLTTSDPGAAFDVDWRSDLDALAPPGPERAEEGNRASPP